MRSGKLFAVNDVVIYDLLSNDRYDVRSNGDIYIKILATGEWRQKKIRQLKGYCQIGYKGKKLLVHRIVYAKFNGKLESDLVINHIDRDGLNNHKDNLELIKQSDNNKHQFLTGRKPTIGHRRMTDEQILNIRSDRESGMTYSQLMIKYDICKSQVSYIVNKKTWKAL